LFGLFSLIVLASILVPKLFAPLIDRRKRRLFVHQLQEFEKPSSRIFREGIYELLLSNLIHKLDLLYKPWAFVQNFVKQLKGKPFVWKTGAMGELETQEMTPLQVYKSLWIAPCLGLILLGLVLNGLLSNLMACLLLPYYSSFLLGPYFIWQTAQPIRDEKSGG
jgi:hypothetical protein